MPLRPAVLGGYHVSGSSGYDDDYFPDGSFNGFTQYKRDDGHYLIGVPDGLGSSYWVLCNTPGESPTYQNDGPDPTAGWPGGIVVTAIEVPSDAAYHVTGAGTSTINGYYVPNGVDGGGHLKFIKGSIELKFTTDPGSYHFLIGGTEYYVQFSASTSPLSSVQPYSAIGSGASPAPTVVAA